MVDKIKLVLTICVCAHSVNALPTMKLSNSVISAVAPALVRNVDDSVYLLEFLTT